MSDSIYREISQWARNEGYDHGYMREPKMGYEEFISLVITVFRVHDICEIGNNGEEFYAEYENAYRQVVIASQF